MTAGSRSLVRGVECSGWIGARVRGPRRGEGVPPGAREGAWQAEVGREDDCSVSSGARVGGASLAFGEERGFST